MTRFKDYDNDDEFAVLDYGRWQRNSRAALKSRRGRKALAEIRDALLALPEKRLIEGALCTVGGVSRVADVTDEEIDAYIGSLKEAGLWGDRDFREHTATFMRSDRAEEREQIAENIEGQGCGVCLNGALLWHRLVKGGMDPGEAFASLPTVITDNDGDPLDATAALAAKDAGIAYTLAWNLAYRNDETYGKMTPEQRYEAFLAWINDELGEPEESAA
jgi:hypothetical protein